MATLRNQPRKELPGTVLATLEYQWKIAHHYTKHNQPDLSRQVLRCLLQKASENQFTLHPSITQRMCTFCGTLFVPEETCHVRLQGKIPRKRNSRVNKPTRDTNIIEKDVEKDGIDIGHEVINTDLKTRSTKCAGRTLHNPNSSAGKSLRKRFCTWGEAGVHTHKHPSIVNHTQQPNMPQYRNVGKSNTCAVVIHCSYCSRNSTFAGGARNERKAQRVRRTLELNDVGQPISNTNSTKNPIGTDMAHKAGKSIASKSTPVEGMSAGQKHRKVGKPFSGIVQQPVAAQVRGGSTAESGKITKKNKKGKKGLKALLQKNAKDAQGNSSGGGGLSDFLSLL